MQNFNEFLQAFTFFNRKFSLLHNSITNPILKVFFTISISIKARFVHQG